MDMPLKAPIPAATGRGASNNVKNSKNSIAYLYKSYNPNAETYIAYYPEVDYMLGYEAFLERKLAMCLLTHPAKTISEMLDTEIYPERDPHVKRFWETVHANSAAILAEGPEKAAYLVLHCVEDPWDIVNVWSKCIDLEENLYTSITSTLRDLRRNRISRKGLSAALEDKGFIKYMESLP